MDSILPQVTSLQSQLSSVSAGLATATGTVQHIEYSRSFVNIEASLSYLSYEAILATATDSAVVESAYAELEIYSEVISSLQEDENLYGTTPSLAGNIVMAVAMGIFFVIHSALGIFYQMWWFGISYFCGCGLEMAGYIGRSLSAQDVSNVNDFLLQIICLTIAPVFIMAGIYYLLAQLIMIYGVQFALLKPMWYSYIFITCDVISLVIQAAGGGIAASNVRLYKSGTDGTHIMVAGLAFQVFSMSIFLLLFFHFLFKISYFNRKVHNELPFNSKYTELRARPYFKYFPMIIIAAVTFVYVRCIYRVVELAEGWSGFLITHEIYFMILDALMMGLSILIFIPFHPGIVYGKNNHISVQGMKNHKVEDEEKDQELLQLDSSD